MAKPYIQFNVALSLEENAQLEALVRAYGLRSRAELVRSWIRMSAQSAAAQEPKS